MSQEKKEKVLVLVGATASGKTDFGVGLAKVLNGEIISADSMQIYKDMSIGTAKVKKEEMQGIPHYLVDCLFPNEEYSVASFKKEALVHIKDILSRKKLPIVVGGTGLYINGLTLPWEFKEKNTDEKVRRRLETEADILGKEILYQRLKETDPLTAATVHPNNVKRVIRALEIVEITGKTKSYFDEKARAQTLPYDYRLFGLKWPRHILYERIDKRVDKMLTKGLEDEIKMLLEKGYTWNLTALKAIGYKELKPYLDKEVTLEEATENLKRETRHFAKRQMTWFRKDHRIYWLDMNKDSSELIKEAQEMFGKKETGENSRGKI